MIRLDSDKGNLPSDPAYNARHRNPTSMKDDYDKIVNDSVEKSQLEHSVNAVEIDYEDPKLPIYGKLDDPSVGTKGETEFPKYPETERFAKEHFIDEQEIRSRKASKPKFATEDIRDGKRGA
jgi:hypothetical protein